jgi:hypothetical protein
VLPGKTKKGNKKMTNGPHNFLPQTPANVVHDLAVIKHHVDADPFAAEVSGLRAFYFAACCIHKSATTGKGRYLASRHLGNMKQLLPTFADATDVLRRTLFAANEAHRKAA